MKKAAILALCCITMLVFSSCELQKENDAGNKHDNYKSKEQPVSLTNLVVSSNLVKVKGNKEYTVKLVMTKGTYFDSEHGDIGGGIADENYVGKYEFQVFDVEKKVSTYSLEENGDMENIIINQVPFELIFSDYNEDQNPDFSFGQWGSSNINIFSLFTILEDGKIKPLTDPFYIATSEQKYEQDYSILFACENKIIRTEWYNNATGEMETNKYKWDEEKQRFLEE